MKVVFSFGFFDSKSGICKVVDNIAKVLACQSEYDVSILCTGGDGENYDIQLNNIDIYNIDIEKFGHRRKYLYYTKAIRESLEKLRPDIVIVSGTEHVLFYNAAISKLSFRRPKLYVWEHRNFSAGPKFRLEWFGKRCAVKHWDGVICITKKDSKQYINYCKTPGKIHQIYNLSDFHATRKTYDINSKKIISCGYLAHIKGFDMLIKVARIVFDRHPDWSWDIFGEGSERENLQSLIKENKLEKNVFLRGYADNINEKYSEYSFFVLTSRAEGMGMVLIEAQRSGLPIISFDINCGPSDVITDGVNGYLIEPFKIEIMAEKINELIEHPEERIEFSHGADMNLSEFDKEYILNKWYQLLNG